MLGLDEDVKSLSRRDCNTPINPTLEVGKIKIGLWGFDECTSINFNLSILTNSLDQTKLMGHLA